MTGSLLDSFLFTNKVAVRAGIKFSVSCWGALIIALLLNFEHPVWCMITGMISFFAPDHAQVVKKCLFQCFSTVFGGLVGLALMGLVSQAPLMTAILGAIIIFIAATLSYHTRDANITFCCAIFSVTIPIIIMVPGYLGPTSENFISIFIDRVGAILAGIAWASVVSAALWPVFTTEALRGASQKLVDSVLQLNTSFGDDENTFRGKLAGVYGGLIACEDLADNAAVEGHWGRRASQVAREMNRVAIEIASESYTFQQLRDEEKRVIETELSRLNDVMSSLSKGSWKEPRAAQQILDPFIETLNAAIQVDGETPDFTARSLLLTKLLFITTQTKQFLALFTSLMRSEHVPVKGIKIKRYFQAVNSFTTGLRSAILFLVLYGLWYSAAWSQGFLMVIVPIVFSIVLGKAPHPELILRNIVIGTAIGIPVGLVVFVFLGEAPSAVEMLVLAAAPPLFFAFMGLTSMVTFAYSLGFALSYMILVLPMNSQVLSLSVSFAVERSLSVLVGAAILALLYVVLPRRPVLKPGLPPGSLFKSDLQDVLLSTRTGNSATDSRSQSIGLVIDKAVAASAEVDPATKATMIDKAIQVMFLMTQVGHVERHLEKLGAKRGAARALLPWKRELFKNYADGAQRNEHTLVESVTQLGLPEYVQVNDVLVSGTYYLREMDYLIRRIFWTAPLEEISS